MPIDHMVVVSRTLSHDHPEAVREVHRMLSEAAMQVFPEFSRDDMSRSLQMISQYAAQQGLIPRAFAADELFDDLTRTPR